MNDDLDVDTAVFDYESNLFYLDRDHQIGLVGLDWGATGGLLRHKYLEC